jgi:predicted nucleic-acid-binding protein
VRLIVDTNVLVRIAAHDNSAQEKIAKRVMLEAEIVAIPLVTLCELVWVMRSVYKFSMTQIADTIRALLETDNVELDRAATEAGLATLDAGGDFADGVIAHEGKRLGGKVFASFDKTAIDLLKAQGHTTQQL